MLLALTSPQVGAVPPPVAQTTANCTRPVYATDMLVCGDAELRSLDDRLRALLGVSRYSQDGASLIEPLSDWFRRSRQCAFRSDQRACVLAAYRERLAVMTALTVSASPAGQCRLDDAGAASIAEVPHGAILLEDGRVTAVGLDAAPAWQPFVRYVRRREKAAFVNLDGKTVATCRLDGGKRTR